MDFQARFFPCWRFLKCICVEGSELHNKVKFVCFQSQIKTVCGCGTSVIWADQANGLKSSVRLPFRSYFQLHKTVGSGLLCLFFRNQLQHSMKLCTCQMRIHNALVSKECLSGHSLRSRWCCLSHLRTSRARQDLCCVSLVRKLLILVSENVGYPRIPPTSPKLDAWSSSLRWQFLGIPHFWTNPYCNMRNQCRNHSWWTIAPVASCMADIFHQ